MRGEVIARLKGIFGRTQLESGRTDRGILPIFAKIATLVGMSTMNVSLPDSMKAFVDEQVERKGYGSSSEYIRDLLRKEQDREHLRGLLLEGLVSPVVGESDKAYFDGLRQRIRDRAAAAKSRAADSARPAAPRGTGSVRKKA